ncbi:MAG: DUF2752 domain-containing protein [Clostridia bacterium]|nr:DUF2752 domain-containing protein [Clostridia bacterium]
MKPSSKKQFLLVHAILLSALLLFWIGTPLIRRLFPSVDGCFLHRYLFLYCPMCGGTRALEALLHLQILRAIELNAYVVLLAAVFLGMDAVALIRLLRGKEDIYRFSRWIWIVLGVALVLFFVLRNYLMIRFGYDGIGDFSDFWGRT